MFDGVAAAGLSVTSRWNGSAVSAPDGPQGCSCSLIRRFDRPEQRGVKLMRQAEIEQIGRIAGNFIAS